MKQIERSLRNDRKFPTTENYNCMTFDLKDAEEKNMDAKTMTKNCVWNCLEKPIRELLEIRGEMLRMEDSFHEQTKQLPENNRYGARNLLHYLALRQRDIRPLQEKFASCGLSSLGRCESRASANLYAVLRVAGV